MKNNKLKAVFNKVASSRLSIFLPTIILVAISASSGCIDQGQSFDFDSFIDSISNIVDPTVDPTVVAAVDPVTVVNAEFNAGMFASECKINDCVQASESNCGILSSRMDVYNPNNSTELIGQVPVRFDGTNNGDTYNDIFQQTQDEYIQKAEAIQSVARAGTVPDIAEFSEDCLYASESNWGVLNSRMDVYDPKNLTELIGQVPVEFNGRGTTYAEIVGNTAAEYTTNAEALQSVARAGTVPDIVEFSKDCFQAEGGVFTSKMNVYNPNNSTEFLGQVSVEFDGRKGATYVEIVENAAAEYAQKAEAIQSMFAAKTSAVSNVVAANTVKP